MKMATIAHQSYPCEIVVHIYDSSGISLSDSDLESDQIVS